MKTGVQKDFNWLILLASGFRRNDERGHFQAFYRGIGKTLTMAESTAYVLIQGPSYRGLGFEAREGVREGLRDRLAAHGVRFLQYDWVWDEEDRCLLLVGRYRNRDDAFWWIRALESMGFDICIRGDLPGEAQQPAEGSTLLLFEETHQDVKS